MAHALALAPTVGTSGLVASQAPTVNIESTRVDALTRQMGQPEFPVRACSCALCIFTTYVEARNSAGELYVYSDTHIRMGVRSLYLTLTLTRGGRGGPN